MTAIWFYTLVSVGVVSLISFVGIVGLAFREETLKRVLMYLVSFSAGALLGDVFLHILPEIAENEFSTREGVYFLIGIFVFFVLEKFIHWHHSHSEHSEEIHSMVYLTQIGDTLHNFLDGLIIAGSFLVSIPVGIATTLAVVFHEIPQEIGNFAIFIHGGWSKRKALLYNFFSALASVLGALVVLVFFRVSVEVPTMLLSLGAASFIYIALTDLIPELHKEKDVKKSLWYFTWFILGTGCMALLLALE